MTSISSWLNWHEKVGGVVNDVLCEVSGDVAVVTVHRPEVKNAQTPQMWLELAKIGAELVDQVKAVVLTGAGDTFSAGMDKRMFTPEGIPGTPSIFEFTQMSDTAVLEQIEAYQQGFAIWADAPFVTFAAVEGHAIGAGFQLALACDVIVAAEHASFAMKEVSWGLVPDLTGTWPLIERCGQARALELCLTGAMASAREPGLANHVVPDGAALTVARELAERLPERALTQEISGLLKGASRDVRRAQRERERQAQLRRIRALA